MSADEIEDPEFVSIEDVMPLIGQKNSITAYQFVKRNGVPFYRLGQRRMVFDLNEVRAWVRSRRVGRIPVGNAASPSVRAALTGGEQG